MEITRNNETIEQCVKRQTCRTMIPLDAINDMTTTRDGVNHAIAWSLERDDDYYKTDADFIDDYNAGVLQFCSDGFVIWECDEIYPEYAQEFWTIYAKW